MKRLVLPLLLFLGQVTAWPQAGPVCPGPVAGPRWKCIGPLSLPQQGPGARFSQLGTGAELRIKFQDASLPDPKVLLACTPTGGLFRTKDATADKPVWENLTDNSRLPILGVRDFAFVPGEEHIIYIGTGIRYPLNMRRTYGIGVLKSVDDGRTWQPTGLQFAPPGRLEEVCHSLLVAPDSARTVHVLCGPHYYQSADGGTHFTLIKSFDEKCPAGWDAAFRDIALKPGDPQTIYLSTDHRFLYISRDGGHSWAPPLDMVKYGVPPSVVRMDIAVTPLDPQRVYVSCASKKGAVILRSDNEGRDWEVVFRKKISTSYERNDLAVSATDADVLYAGGVYLYRIQADPTKRNSTMISSGLHPDHRGLLIRADSAGRDVVFSANDGGLYRGRLPQGKKRWQWDDISGTGLNNTQFYGIGVAEDLSVIAGGSQDNGIIAGDSTGRFFKPRIGGDGADCAVNPLDPGLVYGIQWGGTAPQVWLSKDGGKKFEKQLRNGLTDKADTYYPPLEAGWDGSIYFGTRNVFRLPFGADTWQPVGELNLPTTLAYRVLSVAVAPYDPDVIYAVGDLLYKTTNARADSVVWQKISSGMGKASKPYGAGGEMSAVTLDPANPQRVWVGIRNYHSPLKVCYSPDGGATWIAVSKGLPPFPVNDIAFQAGTPDAVYVGTDVGVFYNPAASDTASQWRCFNNGLPVCIVADLEMNYCAGKILAGTFGRGSWAAPFATPSVFEQVAVGKDTTWENRVLRSDVIVEKGATLTLRGEIRMAAGKKFILEKNSTLLLDGAHLDALCGDTWGGIEVADTPNFIQRFFGARRGELIRTNGASIRNAVALP
ncbi:MAG TPA: hypothetical protein ENJ20_02270 [Bacteroidetes bacterium]|nr:hypothetical protein [Bacteroidota bacterium]